MSGTNLQVDVEMIERIDAIPSMLDVICRSTGMGFAAVARVTDHRWVACSVLDQIAFGLKAGDELSLQTTICDEIRQHKEPVIIDDVDSDPEYRSHHTPAMYKFRSYISTPIFRRNGEFFGTLCAIDPAPSKLKNPQVAGMFKLFAELIGFHLDAQDQLERSQARLVTSEAQRASSEAQRATSEAALLSERQGAELREQFIAVLGHDLRNPLASLSAGTHVMRRLVPDDAKALAVLTRMDKSVLRMAGLIDNVLDFARGRLGGGFLLEFDEEKPLEPELQQVVDELSAAWPERKIVTQFNLTRPVRCQHSRIAQLLSNLIANALTHGAPDQPIIVAATTTASEFALSVTNKGTPLAPDVLDRLFQPFFRAAARPSQQGLGLGLFIVSEIARAHGGEMSVESNKEGTAFTFRMPI